MLPFDFILLVLIGVSARARLRFGSVWPGQWQLDKHIVIPSAIPRHHAPVPPFARGWTHIELTVPYPRIAFVYRI